VVDLVILEIYFQKKGICDRMFLTNYFVQNDENLLQKSCVVKAGSISPKREIQNSKIQNELLFKCFNSQKQIYLFIYSPPPSTFSFCSKDDQSATREFSQIWLQDK